MYYFEELPIGCECDYCRGDILVGHEAWRGEKECFDFTICDIWCLVRFTAKYDMDMDEFYKVVIDE